MASSLLSIYDHFPLVVSPLSPSSGTQTALPFFYPVIACMRLYSTIREDLGGCEAGTLGKKARRSGMVSPGWYRRAWSTQACLMPCCPQPPLLPAPLPTFHSYWPLSEARQMSILWQRELTYLIKVSNEELCVLLNYCLSLLGEGLEWDFFFTCFCI